MHEIPASAGWGPCTFLPGPARALGPAQTVRTERGPSIHIDCVRLRGPRTSAHTVIGSPCRQAGKGPRWRMATQKCVGCRENRSGVRKIGRGVAFRPGAGGGPDTGMAGEARARPLTPPMPRGQGSMANQRCRRHPATCRTPTAATPTPAPAPGGLTVCDVKDAEGTREPQKPWRVCESSTFPGCATGPAAGEPVHAMRAGEGRASRRSSKTEGTREPRQSWRLRAGGAANEPCLAGMCHGSGPPNPRLSRAAADVR